MRSVFVFLSIVTFFCASCEKEENRPGIVINLSSVQNYNYIYDDLETSYSLDLFDKKLYILKYILYGMDGEKRYESELFDTVSSETSADTIQAFMDILWTDGKDQAAFYKIENAAYNIELQAVEYNTKNQVASSNRIAVEINKENPDTSLIGNFILTDINNNKHEFVQLIREKDYVFLFSFAVWCGWSSRSIPSVRFIDSVYSEKINTFGIEGYISDNSDSDWLFKFIHNSEIDFRVCPLWSNHDLEDVFPKQKSFPRFYLLNNERKVIFQQTGYSENLPDTISYYINKN